MQELDPTGDWGDPPAPWWVVAALNLGGVALGVAAALWVNPITWALATATLPIALFLKWRWPTAIVLGAMNFRHKTFHDAVRTPFSTIFSFWAAPGLGLSVQAIAGWRAYGGWLLAVAGVAVGLFGVFLLRQMEWRLQERDSEGAFFVWGALAGIGYVVGAVHAFGRILAG